MSAIPQAIEMTQIAARAAADKKGHDLVAFDVSEHLAITDVFLIVSGSSERQVDAIVDAVDEAMARAGHRTRRREGERENRWVLLDFGDVVVHVQHEDKRETYSLERLWHDCPRVDTGVPEEERTSDEQAGTRQDAAEESA